MEYHFSFICDPDLNKLMAPQNALYRPQIKWLKFSLCVVLFMVFQVLLAFAEKHWLNVEISPTSSFFNLAISGFLVVKKLALFAVHCYQRYAPAHVRLKCCMEPSCSQYMAISLRKYGFIVGAINGYKRYCRCEPPGEVDYP